MSPSRLQQRDYSCLSQLECAESLASSLPCNKAIALDVLIKKDLDQAVATHNLVISLIPYVHHTSVIKSAIESKSNVVTTSYVSPAIRNLDTAATEASIVVLIDVGLDLGFNHLYAIKTIGEAHAKGGEV